ncbi:MAG: DNA repair protein RadA [Bacillota bacterium]|nr:DNA repair protein RadA [Bacillota bacterium]
MGKKAGTVFVCQECGYESPKWMGQCVCGAWNSMVEEKLPSGKGSDVRRRSPEAFSRPVKLSQVRSGEQSRIHTGIGELDRVLGGGLVLGSLTLISGEPGIGKSTLLIQCAARIAEGTGTVLYVTGEESEEQIKIRADRVCSQGTDRLFLLAETNMERVMEVTEELQPAFLIIDSIQTMYSEALESAAGTVSQVRACANELMRMGKGRGIPVFIVAHVTKSGDLAGPKIIEHLVDCVLNFTGERDRELRILRAYKNRFGTTSEIGAFLMEEKGLVEVENLSASFLEDREDGVAGSVATAVYEGTRPLLLEIQALTSPTHLGFPRRTALGVELSRLNMILGVLDRKAGISLIDQDVYVNVVGGLKPEGTSTDLAVALAIWSARRGRPLPRETLVMGEIGLTGHLRSVANGEKIAREAGRLGFTAMLLPAQSAAAIKDRPKGMKLLPVNDLRDAIKTVEG